MGQQAAPAFVAGGNISCSVFVKLSTAADDTVLQAGANDSIIGISQVGTKVAPGLDTTGYCAVAGDNLQVYGQGETCMLLAGTGGWTRGDSLKSDANGAGVSIATTGATAQEVGAVALESAAAGELSRVTVRRQTKTYPALA